VNLVLEVYGTRKYDALPLGREARRSRPWIHANIYCPPNYEEQSTVRTAHGQHTLRSPRDAWAADGRAFDEGHRARQQSRRRPALHTATRPSSAACTICSDFASRADVASSKMSSRGSIPPYPPLCSQTFIAYSNWPATPPTSMLLGPAQKLTSWVGRHHHAANRRSSSSRARTPPRPTSKLVVPDQVPQPLRLSEATIRCGSHHHQIYNGASTRCCICSSELSESLLTNTRGQAA